MELVEGDGRVTQVRGDALDEGPAHVNADLFDRLGLAAMRRPIVLHRMRGTRAVRLAWCWKNVEVAPSLLLSVIGRTVGRAANRAGKTAAGGEVDLDGKEIKVAAADPPGRDQTQRQLQ
jgi:hypothetical protein